MTRALAIALWLGVAFLAGWHASQAWGSYTDYRMTEIARFYSGVQDIVVTCGNNDAEWDQITHDAGYTTRWIDGFTYTGSANHTIYMAPWICEAFQRGTRYTEFSGALQTFIHEGYHWRLGKNEALVECASLISVRGAMLNFWHVGYHSALAERIFREARYYSSRRPPEYQGSRYCVGLQ